MKNSVHRLAVALSLVLLAFGFVGVLQAGEGGEGKSQPVELIGQLSQTSDGDYVLVEQDSGEEISIRAQAELADHLGAKVRVTGEWAMDDDGNEYFAASKVEPAD